MDLVMVRQSYYSAILVSYYNRNYGNMAIYSSLMLIAYSIKNLPKEMQM